MELRFSRCSVALLLLLLFVAANAVRGPEVPVDEPRLPAPRSRGSSRFNTQTAKTIETTLDPISIRKPSNRRGVSNQKANGFPTSSIVPERTLKSTKVESNSRNRKFDPKKSIDKNRSTSSSIDLISTTPKAIFNKKGGRQSTGSRQEAPEAAKFQKVSRQSSRSVPSDQVKKAFLDKNGPSVFSAPGNSNETRSRTGRKIQTAFTQRELRSEISASKRFASRRSDDHIDDLKSEIKSDSRTKNATRKTHDLTKRDPLPAESENINVPAILEVTRRSAPSTPSTISEETDFRKSDRGSRSRGKTSFAENIRTDESNKSNSRRGSSRSSEQLGTEQTDFNRRNEYRFSKDEVDTIKLRSSEIKSRISDADSRSRGRFTSQDAQANSRDSKTPSTTSAVLERRNGGRDSRSRTQEVDSRKRSRTRPRVEQTTLSQDIVTVFPEITASSGRSDSDSGLTANVQTASSKSATTGAPSNRVLSTTTSSRASRRESEGTTRSRTRTGTSRRTASKEDFYNHGLGFRGRRPLPDPSTVSTVGTITTTEVPQRVTTNPQESQARGNPGWSLHRRPYTGAESSLVTLEEEIATTSASVSKPPGRRGNKTFVKTPGESLASVKQENLDNENYPPDFKAKLAQLKNSGSASAAKPTPNSPLQGNKKATTSLFSARSRMKLENARKLVKPELLDEETDSINERKHLDIDEEKKLENKLSDLHTESTLGQESVVKPKLARPKKNHETSKVRNFIPKSRNSTVKEEKKTIESSSERIRKNENSSKTRSSFNIRSKSKIENRVESNNSLGRGKSFSRRNKTSEYSSTTQKPKSTLIRHLSKNTNENKSKLLPSRKPLLSRYRNASTAKSGSKVSFHRGTTPSNQIKSTDFNTIGETTENPVTIKNYISVTKSVSTTISEEISTKKLRTKLFNDLSRSSVDETRLLKTKNLKDEQTTAKNFRPTSRYSRKKVQAFKINSAANVSVATSGDEKMNSSQKIDPRSRTATYRRHSEVPLSLLRSSTVEPNSIEITPKATRFKVSSSPSPQLVTQEPAVNVKVSNDSTSVQQQSLQILQDGNAFTGNSGNIFSPTKNILVTAGNVSLLDQIRSTVAPLLGSLGARSPIFSGIYNNATNINTAVRITPNGSPPRFSARYKGAELFVRNPSISQSAVPKITSSTTPFTPIENSGSSPPIEVSSNGEPKVVTFYQALESASITDEQLKTNLQQLGRVAQDSSPATAQTTARPNLITSNLLDFPYLSRNPTTLSTRLLPTSFNYNLPTTTPSTRLLPTSFGTTTSSLNNFETTYLPIETTSSPLNNIGTTLSPSSNVGTTLPPTNSNGGNFPTSTSSPSTTATLSSSKLLSIDATPVSNPGAASGPAMITPYAGRFGGLRITPAPRFSSSSSTTAPLRDYLIYGIYPNKTIVRKRPEDNLIDARNVDSPYVIFGIYPDGRLVRKFPNGTVIPDPPSNPVEVVFSLSTTTSTTNRPSLSAFTDIQANQSSRNQNAALSNSSPVATLEKQISLVGTNDVDNGLSGNAIDPIGTTSPVPPTVDSGVSTTQTMVINAPNATSSVPSATSSSSSNSNVVVGSNGSQQGGRIIQDRERDEATRTREAGGQRNSMYIGQDKFINYWINNQPNSNPQVLNVKINSVSTASSQGAGNSPGKLPSFHLSPNSGSGIITVAPNFAWKDPLDQIFGITTNSPPISASVASNILDDANAQNAQIFAPKSSGISSTSSTISSTSPPSTTMPTNPTTALANDPLITTTTANLKLVNTLDGSGVKENPFGTTYDDLAFLNTLLNTQRFGRTTPKTLTEVEKLLADKILSLALGKAGPTRSPKAIQPSNASPNLLIETDPDPEYGPVVIDLYPSSTTEKSNPATWKPITSTSPVIVNPWKTLLNGIAANQIHISTPNSIVGVSSSLRSLYEQQTTAASIPKTTTSTPRTTTTTTTTTPRTTTTTTTPRTTTTTTTTQRTTTTTTTTTEKPTTPRLTTTTGTTTTTGKITIIPRLTFTTIPISTTTIKSPTRQLEITTKPFRPRTTTAAPRWGFGSNLLRVLFGGNIFGTPTTPAPMRNKKPVRPLTTAIPVTSTQRFEPTSKNMASNSQVLLSTQDAIQVTPHVRVTKEQPSVNLKAVSSSAVGVNEGNLKLTQSSTFSPEEDAKFLMSLLNVAQSMGSSTLSPMGEVSKDDEAFLRAILNGQASVQPSSKGENVKSDAALLAALLKDEGIGPYSPPNQLREQLFSAGLEKHRDAQISTTTAPTTTITMKTTTRSRPAAPTWKPSSTYPPPLFGGFNFAGSSDSFRGDSTSNDNVRSQVVNAAIGVTRAFSQFLGGAIMGAAKQLQSFVGNGTRPFFS
ncbi:uncharacterized threonine-rich GPI-anchored glycoprotein PJ4664.02-like isoform X4 [Leptopilina heterotoma]|uniref:uncharacterized threonine-rich GPI-anchored glycoprotein PJ4664.02-like isoform X4 n=1 Tax=Leptopilina heterotoma TaxID=63436 RepID=UPI001CA92416|nr:uncharacterized threonine-rich GPI-anchored glycoprotein PJ4664.02-like isoform X4 [Leptopilina heterotoma]